MNMKKAIYGSALFAATTIFALTATAADRPTLTIDSPANNAVVQPTAGLGEVVIIKFSTQNFQIADLNGAKRDSNKSDTMSATAGTTDKSPMTASAGATADTNKSMPQSDQSGMANMSMAANEGHVHVFVDNNKWYFVHSTSDPIVLVGLDKGTHTVKLDLVGNDHKSTGVTQSVSFNVPK